MLLVNFVTLSFVYTVIFQHFFQSSITRSMKSIFELKEQAVGWRCSKTLLKKDSGKGAFLWNMFVTYTYIFFIISNKIFASACFCSITYLTLFLETMQIYFLSNVFLLKSQTSEWPPTFVFSCMFHSPFTKDHLF